MLPRLGWRPARLLHSLVDPAASNRCRRVGCVQMYIRSRAQFGAADRSLIDLLRNTIRSDEREHFGRFTTCESTSRSSGRPLTDNALPLAHIALSMSKLNFKPTSTHGPTDSNTGRCRQVHRELSSVGGQTTMEDPDAASLASSLEVATKG